MSFGLEEIIVEKGENAGYQHFLLFPRCFFFLFQILEKLGINSTYIYSSLDPTARKINIAKFQHRKVMVLVVTDLAARGIDIPLLDNVVNFHFPAQPKLFVHRVGKFFIPPPPTDQLFNFFSGWLFGYDNKLFIIA